MSSVYKRIARDEDRDEIISGLPKHLLDNILECLPMRDAVQTSILSRKWRYLWSGRTTLVFDKEFFKTNFGRKPSPAYAYMILIHNMLLLHTGPVLSFTLYIPKINWDWDAHIDKWLLFLSRNGINQLEIVNPSTSPYKLPSCIFSCPSLKILNVRNCLFTPPDTGLKFANLGLFSFDDVSFSPDAYRFILNLPLLTSLSFYCCTTIENLKISAPKLARFVAFHCNDVKSFPLDKFCNLARVIISIANEVYDQRIDSSFNFGKFLEKLPSVRYLAIDGPWLKLSAATTFQKVLPFMPHHLTHLALLWLRFDDLDQILCALCLLRSLPSLKTLDIAALPFEGNARESISSHLEAPDCMGEMVNLQKVIITSYECLNPLLPLVKSILARSPGLLSMHFDYIFDKSEEFNVSAELLRFPRALSKAEVIYSCGARAFDEERLFLWTI